MGLGERIAFTKPYVRNDGLILAHSGDKGTVIGTMAKSDTFFVEVDIARDDFYERMWVSSDYVESQK